MFKGLVKILTSAVIAYPVLAIAPAWSAPSTSNATNQYPIPAADQRLVGQLRTRTLTRQDTLAAIARKELVGFDALKNANRQIDAWLPEEGAMLVLPTMMLLPDGRREGILINLAEKRLYYFDNIHERLHIYPVGIGVVGADTPIVNTHTVARIHKPSWTPTATIRRESAAKGKRLPWTVAPGPSNPLGEYAIKLAEPGLFIHGTNRPFGVGQRISHGCIRLYADHIKTLATSVPNGTPVRIVNQHHKVGWHEGNLYLESHANEHSERQLTSAMQQIIQITKVRPSQIDWTLATATARAATGIPVNLSVR